MPDDLKVAQALEQQILGNHRKAMPCGCVMLISNRRYSGGRPYRVLFTPWHSCDEHEGHHPYLNQVLDE